MFIYLSSGEIYLERVPLQKKLVSTNGSIKKPKPSRKAQIRAIAQIAVIKPKQSRNNG